MSLENCSRCSAPIADGEPAHLIGEKVVCAACYKNAIAPPDFPPASIVAGALRVAGTLSGVAGFLVFFQCLYGDGQATDFGRMSIGAASMVTGLLLIGAGEALSLLRHIAKRRF